MKQNKILVVEIDQMNKLHIKPEFEKFVMIYRTATEVHWNTEKQTLYSPKPRNWTYLEWFDHIIKVAKEECSCELNITEWINISSELKNKITKAQQQV